MSKYKMEEVVWIKKDLPGLLMMVTLNLIIDCQSAGSTVTVEVKMCLYKTLLGRRRDVLT